MAKASPVDKEFGLALSQAKQCKVAYRAFADLEAMFSQAVSLQADIRHLQKMRESAEEERRLAKEAADAAVADIEKRKNDALSVMDAELDEKRSNLQNEIAALAEQRTEDQKKATAAKKRKEAVEEQLSKVVKEKNDELKAAQDELANVNNRLAELQSILLSRGEG